MYLIDNEITATWVLAPTAIPLTANDFDISIMPSSLEGTYTDGGVINYTAPTVDTAGSLSYAFTPTAPGKYEVTLGVGTGLTYSIQQHTKNFWAFAIAPITLNSLKVTGALSYPQEPPPKLVNEGSFGEQINTVGYDPVNKIVAVSVYNTTTTVDSVIFTTPELDVITDRLIMTDVTGWVNSSFTAFEYIEYVQELSIWVGVQGNMVAGTTANAVWYNEGDPTNAAQWFQATLPTSWTGGSTSTNVRGVHWNVGLQMFQIGCTSSFDTAEALVSVDCKTFFAWDDYQILGGSEPQQYYWFHDFDLDGTHFHMGQTEEDYAYRQGNANAGVLPGAAQAWSKTSANGVLRNTSGVNLHHLATDGVIVAVDTFIEMNATKTPQTHPGSWGPSGNSNVGWRDNDMGFNLLNETRLFFAYLPQFERPWIMNRHASSQLNHEVESHGWWDAAEIIEPAGARTSLNAPQFQRCTVEPFASWNALQDADYSVKPSFSALKTTFYGNFMVKYNSGAALGKNGWWVVFRGAVADRSLDWMAFQEPSL
jgi:hypothetical protein